jgi:hypothetical protein
VGIPSIKSAFHLQMPDIRAWGIIFALGFTPLVLNEIIKLFIRVLKKTPVDQSVREKKLHTP